MKRNARFGWDHTLRYCSALALGITSLGLAACENGDVGAIPSTELAPLVQEADARTQPERMDLVFESRVAVSDENEIVDSNVAGDLDQAQRERVARPYRFVDEPTLYAEEAWSRGGEDGVTERGYRVWKRANKKPLDIHARTSGAPQINRNVAKHVAEARADETLELDLKLRDFPAWDIPLAPPAAHASPADIKAVEERRSEAMAEREATFDKLAAGLIAQVEALGGRASTSFKKTGWLSVTLPASAFPALARSNAIARIDGPYGKSGGANGWSLGEGRQAAYLNADRFHAAGHTGEISNAARHAYGDIVVGMNEPGGYESGACVFKDGAGCTGASRVIETYRCDFTGTNVCQLAAVDTNTSDDSHGTMTTSIVLGDYMDGQGNGKALNDTAWASNTCTSSAQCGGELCEGGLCSHSPTWENQRTGMAPEASAILFGISSGSAGYTDMFAVTAEKHLDISSNSWGWGTTDCDIDSNSALEESIEDAYDDGVLVVFAAGNDNGDDATSCTMRDPADTPKVLTVNAYDAGQADCETSPSTRCLLDRDSCSGDGCSARGGASVEVAGRGVQANAVSVIDLVAPNDVTNYTTQTAASDGIAANSGRFVGTSAAAPHVAGLAALVKSWYLDGGQGWVNSPGRLHTIMLAMGDRHFSSDPSDSTISTTQLAATPDKWYGLGRARLRLLENGGGVGNWGNHMATYTFTSQSGVTYYPFGKSPMPSGVEIVKCVAMQVEDMSNKTNISEIKLSVRVRPTATGTACTGTATLTRISDNFDTKKVAALSGYSFTNQCVEVQLDAENVTTQGVTVHAMCYYAGVNDDDTL